MKGSNLEVIDVNDNVPEFDQPEYRRVVRIGDAEFQPPLIVKATDKDGPLQVRTYLFYIISVKC